MKSGVRALIALLAALGLSACGSLEDARRPQVQNAVIYRVKSAAIADRHTPRRDIVALPNIAVNCGLLRGHTAIPPASAGPPRDGDGFVCFADLPAGRLHWLVSRDGGRFTSVKRT